MRIAIIVPGFSAHVDDWAIPALQSLSTHLAQSHEVTVISMRYPAKGEYRLGAVKVVALGLGQTYRYGSMRERLLTVQAIIRQHRKAPFDVLHAFWADEPGTSAIWAGARIRRPVIVSIGGGELTHLSDIKYGSQLYWFRRLMIRQALTGATRVTAGSPYQIDLCRGQGVPDAKLNLAPLGVDTAHFRPSTNPPTALTTLVQAASLISVKNQRLLLDVLQRVADKMPQIKLDLIGSGPLQADLQQTAQALSLEHHIQWRDHIPHRRMPRAYAQTQLYVQTSYHESQGMSVLEAMACGVPVVGTPVGVVRDAACLPATESAAVLADQVLAMLGDSEQYQAYAREARVQVKDDYSIQTSSDQFEGIYEAGI